MRMIVILNNQKIMERKMKDKELKKEFAEYWTIEELGKC